MKNLLSLLIVGSSCLLAASAIAENAQQNAKLARSTVNLERFSLAKDASTDLGVGDYANALSGSYRWYNTQKSTIFNIGLGVVFYDDAKPFNQDVTLNGSAYTENRESQVTSMLLEADYGWLKFVGAEQKNYWTLRAGYTLLPFAKRDISRIGETCENCKEEKVDITGGVYGVIGFGHQFSSADMLIEYRHYATGDLNAGLRLTMGIDF